jgi:hypothetical protein
MTISLLGISKELYSRKAEADPPILSRTLNILDASCLNYNAQ